MKPALAAPLEAELAAVRADPLDAVGFGDKAYMPYELRRGRALASAAEPEVTARLAAEAGDASAPLPYRLATLHILAQRDDPAVDAALVAALATDELRPVAAYLLGRIGFKGYPHRPRAVEPLLAALRPYLADAGHFTDPWYRRGIPTRDLVIGACVRLAGVERFTFPSAGMENAIGYDLPEWSDAERGALLEQLRRMPATSP